jgi:SRSO17 transposase
VRGPKAEGWLCEAIEGPLNQYRPLRWELVQSVEQRRQWRQLLDAYHYLGAPGMVGANLKYFVCGPAGHLLGALGWQSAVGHLGCRNRLLAWNPEQRARYLDRLVNNVRFLVLPWVKVPGLASVILSEGVRQLQRDWPERYGQEVWWVESFVDRQRFEAVSYRAAGWLAIGWTQGFAKRPEGFVHHGQRKEVYIYVAQPRMRRLIHGDSRQPLLNRSVLLAQRGSEEQRLAKTLRMKRILASWKPELPPQCQLSVAEMETVGQELSAFAALFHQAFGRVEPMQWLELHLQGLLSQESGKNLQSIRRRLDNPGQVRHLERFLSDYRWDESWMAERHWQLAAEALGDPQGVWSIQACQFPKEGQSSVGVAPGYCAALGKRAPCQSGVFIGYSSPKGQALLESRLYLPPVWFEPGFAERRRQCRIPKERAFETQQQVALELLSPLLKTQRFGGHWIACDDGFGNQEDFLEQIPKDFYYLAEIAGTRQVWLRETGLSEKFKTEGCAVEQLLQIQPLLDWQTYPLSEKGLIPATWARRRVYVSVEPTPSSERWLLLRRQADGQIHYALSNAPAEIPWSDLVGASGARWSVARCFQEGKSTLRFDRYEHRSWTAWHRHMRLAFLAQLFLLGLQIKSKNKSSLDHPPALIDPAPPSFPNQ